MSTNYYAMPKMTETNDMPEKIHIGRYVYGCQFCFDHNNWQYFGRSRESLERFLLECEIYDECGRPITNNDFWEMVKETENGQKSAYIEFGLSFSLSAGFS